MHVTDVCMYQHRLRTVPFKCHTKELRIWRSSGSGQVHCKTVGSVIYVLYSTITISAVQQTQTKRRPPMLYNKRNSEKTKQAANRQQIRDRCIAIDPLCSVHSMP